MISKIKHTFEKLKTRMIVLVLAGLAVGIELSAKSMRDLWISMPDSMVSYISKSVREECAALMDMKMKPRWSILLVRRLLWTLWLRILFR